MSKRSGSSLWGGSAAPQRRPLHVDWLVGSSGALLDAPGRVGLSSCPGRADLGGEVERDVRRLAALGIGVVVSLVADAEMELYGAAGLRRAIVSAGLRSLYFPLEDTQPPVDLAATTRLCREILRWLGEGESVLIHCIGGWGRSGTLAAALLTHQGYAAEPAIALVRSLRSPRCVESRAQELFVAEYAAAQARRTRYYLLTAQSALAPAERLLFGPPGARSLSRSAVRPDQLLDAAALAQAVQQRRGEPALAIVSGERAESAPNADLPVDRAFRCDGQLWRAVPIGDLCG